VGSPIAHRASEAELRPEVGVVRGCGGECVLQKGLQGVDGAGVAIGICVWA
jgi:hypothetical protein